MRKFNILIAVVLLFSVPSVVSAEPETLVSCSGTDSNGSSWNWWGSSDQPNGTGSMINRCLSQGGDPIILPNVPRRRQ